MSEGLTFEQVGGVLPPPVAPGSNGSTTNGIRFYEDRVLSAKMSMTPEGYLLCKDVPVARTGIQIYGQDELRGLVPTSDGIIYVNRPEEEVFRDVTMRSFEGKPICIDHPEEDVNSKNWKTYSVGTGFNVRRGDGALRDSMIVDFLITDEDAIQKVLTKKIREVSCGYDASYTQDAPGRGTQTNITGNHFAIVEHGRCGGMCRIGDSEMSTATLKNGASHLSWMDRMRKAFQFRNIDDFEKALKEKPKDDEGENDDAAAAGGTGKEVPGKGPPPKAGAEDDAGGKGPPSPDAGGGDDKGGAGGVHHHITVNVGAAGAAGADAGAAGGAAPVAGAAGADAGTGAAAGGAAADPAAEAASAAQAADPISVLVDAITKLSARMDALEAAVTGAAGSGPDAAAAGMGGATNADEDATNDSATADIVALNAEYQEVVSRAEIIMPGIRVKTLPFDEKNTTTKDASGSICLLRRRALDAAYNVDRLMKHFEGLYDGKTPLKELDCVATKILFNAISDKVRDANNEEATRREATNVKPAVRSIASINEANRAFHEAQKTKGVA